MQLVQLRGRGTAHNPRNRFESAEYLPDEEAFDPDEPGPRTQLMRDHTRGIITRNDSPDVPFDASVNPYRGCEHGCLGSKAAVCIDTWHNLLELDAFTGHTVLRTARRSGLPRFASHHSFTSTYLCRAAPT